MFTVLLIILHTASLSALFKVTQDASKLMASWRLSAFAAHVSICTHLLFHYFTIMRHIPWRLLTRALLFITILTLSLNKYINCFVYVCLCMYVCMCLCVCAFVRYIRLDIDACVDVRWCLCLRWELCLCLFGINRHLQTFYGNRNH